MLRTVDSPRPVPCLALRREKRFPYLLHYLGRDSCASIAHFDRKKIAWACLRRNFYGLGGIERTVRRA